MKHNLGLSFSVHKAYMGCYSHRRKPSYPGKHFFLFFFFTFIYMLHPTQSWPWRRCGRVWSRSESGWSPKWRSRWRWRSSRLSMRPRRSSGVPTARKRPFSIAAGTQATVITPVSKHTGQNTWSPAHSLVGSRALSHSLYNICVCDYTLSTTVGFSSFRGEEIIHLLTSLQD